MICIDASVCRSLSDCTVDLWIKKKEACIFCNVVEVTKYHYALCNSTKEMLIVEVGLNCSLVSSVKNKMTFIPFICSTENFTHLEVFSFLTFERNTLGITQGCS